MSHRAIAHRVDPPDLERVEPKPFRADVEMGFRCEGCLESAERTERARRRVVGVNAERVDLHVGDDIGPGRQNRRLAHDAFGGQAVRATVTNHLHLQRTDAAIAHQAHAKHSA